MTTTVTADNVETISPMGYVNNREVTNLPGHFLVKGSFNTRVVNGEKVASSKRYQLKGQAKTVNNGIQGSYDWKTSTDVYRNIRHYMLGGLCESEVLYKGQWRRFKRAYKKATFRWAEFWSNTEKIDFLLGVNGGQEMFMWTGGVAEVASVTTNTITKQGYIEDSDIFFTAATRTIKRTSGGLLAAGFTVGDSINISNSVSNDGDYEIKTVTDTDIVVTDNYSLVDEGVGAPIILKKIGDGSWGEARFLVTLAGRAVVIGGVTYTYTGGEDTGTLTGVTPDPVANGVVAGDLVVQDIVVSTPAVLQDRNNDLIAVDNNHVYVGSTKSREVFVSKNDDYADFGYTTPLRKPGEGYKLTLDAPPVGFAPDEGENMSITAGDDYWYEIKMTLSADQLGESIEVKRLKTASGQAAVSQESIAFVKNSTAFLSKERTIDTIGNVENVPNQQTTLISDDISLDLEEYDVTNAHLLYFKRSLFVALPREGVVLEYDTRYGYWQPPQYFPVSRLAIIDDRLCGHSYATNETYILFEGYNDIDAPSSYAAIFGYENYGSRFSLKNFTEIGLEIYLTQNTTVKQVIKYEYEAARDIREFVINTDKPQTVFAPNFAASLGSHPLGAEPLGSVATEPNPLVKVRIFKGTTRLDFFERQRAFYAEGDAQRFEILAYSENVKMSDNEPNFIRQ